MPVVSPFIFYTGATAYDLRKVVSVVPDIDNPTRVLVRFIDDNRVVVPFIQATFEPAWQAALIAQASSGSNATYTNPNPVPQTIGGILAGTSFPTPQLMQQMWDMLLYPAQYPQFTSFNILGQANPREVGSTVPANITFQWLTSNPGLIQTNSIKLFDVTGGNLTLATGLANDGTEPILLAAPITLLTAGSYQFKIEGTNTAGSNFSSTSTLQWRWKLYYGTNASPTLDSIAIKALVSSSLAASYVGNYAFAAGGYKYICQSDNMGGQINTVKDANTNFGVPLATAADDPAYSNLDGGGHSYALVSVTNDQGITTNYRVYRTKNSLGGAITLAVT